MEREDLLARLRKLEGFTPRASWDYAQHSNGYGTRAQYPGEVIDQQEAERRLRTEVANAENSVDRFAPNLDPGTRAALVSLTYNAGPKWQSEGLGRAIQTGDLAAARSIFTQYNRAGGQVNDGLVNRRNQEVAWPGAFGSPGAQPSAPQPPDGMDGRTYTSNLAQEPRAAPAAPMGVPRTETAQAPQNPGPAAMLEGLFSGNPVAPTGGILGSILGPPKAAETAAPAAQPAEDATAPYKAALEKLYAERQAAEEARQAEEFALSPMGVPKGSRPQSFQNIVSNARQPVRLGIMKG